MNELYKNLALETILEKGAAIIQEAGLRTVSYFNSYVAHTNASFVTYKKDKSPVTEADTHTELWLRDTLSNLFPDFGIIGEEFGESTNHSNSEYSWVIDPIDGTRAFISGVPLYTTLLGLIHTQTRIPIAGFIYAPITKELIYAADNLGVYYTYQGTTRKVSIDHCTHIAHATVLSYDWQKVYSKSLSLYEMNNHSAIVRTWADGYAYLMLASGRAHAIIDTDMHIWDIMPVYPILKESGAQISAWGNKSIDWNSDNIDIIATTSPELMDIIQANI